MTRAYIAGFGTAGSLLAGASVLFVLATALVSYRGWPQVAYAGSQPALVLPHATIYGVAPPSSNPVLTASAQQPVAPRTASRDVATRTIVPARTRTQPAVTLSAGVSHAAPSHQPPQVKPTQTVTTGAP